MSQKEKMNATTTTTTKTLNTTFAKQIRFFNDFVIAERGDLHLAAERGDLATVQSLLARGADCSANDELGFSPLHQAILSGHLPVVDALLQAGANVNTTGVDHCTPLYLATGTNQLVVVQRLLAVRIIDVQARTQREGFTALHQASMLGYVDIAEALLAGGADIRAETKDKETPLHLSIFYRHHGVFKILIAAGSDIQAITRKGVGCLHLAAASGFTIQGVKVLLSNSLRADSRDLIESTPLHYAATYGHLPIARLLVKRGVDVNLRDRAGSTALHRTAGSHLSWAIRSQKIGEPVNRLEVARFLLAHGANVHIWDCLNHTALHAAVIEGQLGLAACLIEEGGAPVNIGTQTPLHEAVEMCITGHPEGPALVELLLLRGADPNRGDEFGNTVLHVAAGLCNMSLIKLLLAGGAYYDATNITGVSVLWFGRTNDCLPVGCLMSVIDIFYKAVVKNNLTVVRRCLDTDRTVAVCHSAHYKTPLHYPAWKGWVELVVLLLNYGANPNATNESCAPPLHYAAKFGHPLVALALLRNGAVYDAIYPKTKSTPLTMAKVAGCIQVVSLLELVDRLFGETRAGKVGVVGDLRALKKKDRPRYLAVTNARNSQNQKLIDVAMEGKFEGIVACLA